MKSPWQNNYYSSFTWIDCFVMLRLHETFENKKYTHETSMSASRHTNLPAGKEKNDYKPRQGDRLIAPSFRAEIKKSRKSFGGIFFAKQEKIMTKPKTGNQTHTKLYTHETEMS